MSKTSILAQEWKVMIIIRLDSEFLIYDVVMSATRVDKWKWDGVPKP